MEISRLLLQNGDNIKLYEKNNKSYYIINPKIKDIIELEKIEIGLYYKYLYMLTTTSKDEADILLYEANIWYEDIKDEWSFFLQKITALDTNKIYGRKINKSNLYTSEYNNEYISINEEYSNAFNFFFNTKGLYILYNTMDEDGNKNFCLLNVYEQNPDKSYIITDDNFRINAYIYNIMLEVLKKENWISPDYDFLKGGSKYAKKYILKNKYKTRNKEKKIKVDLSSIISSLVAKGQKYEDILNYSIYFVYEQYYRYRKIDEWNNIMIALNSGCIDTKKNPIDYDKIDWSHIIS